jgi:hypothetical protein
MSARRLLLTALAVLVAVAPSRGNPVVAPGPDVAPSRPAPPGPPHVIPPPNGVPIVIEVSDEAQRPRLIVPRKLIERARKVAVGPAAPDAPRFAGRFTPLTAGVALALTFAGAGLLLVRRGVGTRGLTVLLALGGALIGAGLAFAVQPHAVPTPPPPVEITGAVVEVVPEGDAVRLVLSRGAAAELAKMQSPGINWVSPGRRELRPR